MRPTLVTAEYVAMASAEMDNYMIFDCSLYEFKSRAQLTAIFEKKHISNSHSLVLTGEMSTDSMNVPKR